MFGWQNWPLQHADRALDMRRLLGIDLCAERSARLAKALERLLLRADDGIDLPDAGISEKVRSSPVSVGAIAPPGINECG